MTGRSRKQNAISPPKLRPPDLTTQHLDLVTQNNQPHLGIRPPATADEQTEQSTNREIQQREAHPPILATFAPNPPTRISAPFRLNAELENSLVSVVGVTPGWLRSEKMLENFGVSEANWRDALKERPGFGISESPTYVARGVAALARAADVDALGGHDHQRSPARGRLRHHGHRREPAGLLGYLAAYGWEQNDGRGIDEFR